MRTEGQAQHRALKARLACVENHRKAASTPGSLQAGAGCWRGVLVTSLREHRFLLPLQPLPRRQCLLSPHVSLVLELQSASPDASWTPDHRFCVSCHKWIQHSGINAREGSKPEACCKSIHTPCGPNSSTHLLACFQGAQNITLLFPHLSSQPTEK